MGSTMSMMFETADLEQASPATVSRCGMIYIEPYQLGWKPLVNCYLNTLPAKISKQDKVNIQFQPETYNSTQFTGNFSKW